MRNQIRAIVAEHLQGNYTDSLTKFSYLNGGAEQFIKLTQIPNYTSYERELRLIDQILPILRNLAIAGLHVLDFGVGDGKKSEQIMVNISGRTGYVGLDLSPAMIALAQSNSRSGIAYSICDFSDMSQLERIFLSLSDTGKLILMLGNTITNEMNVGNYLRSLGCIVDTKTYLLVGLELLSDDIDLIIREYKNEENYDLTFIPLEMIGIERNHGRIDIDFNSTQERIEEWFIFNRDGGIGDIRYRRGDRILLSVTYKPTIEQIREMIHMSGWSECAGVVDNGYALLLLSHHNLNTSKN